MGRPRGWSLAWVLWLCAFLAVELPAAIRKRGGTLSEWVWQVFALKPPERRFGPARRITFVVFWVVTGAHFVVQLPWGWVVGAGIPFAAVVVYAVGWEGSVTREEWDHEWTGAFGRLRAKGTELLEAQRLAREITTARYGARPAGLPLWFKLAQGVLARKLSGLRSVEVSPMLQRVIVAAAYGIGAAASVISAAFSDGKIEGGEWTGIATAFFIAAWGTFKSNTTIVSPNRTEWTPEQRKVETAKMDAGVLVEEARVVAEKKVEAAQVAADAKAAR